MARFVIDVGTAVEIAAGRATLSGAHTVLAPARLRSDVLDHLYGLAREGQLDAGAARALNAAFAKLKVRYLGDAVLRRRAWDLAVAMDLPAPGPAEYVALVQLQADALITEEAGLARIAAGHVRVTSRAALAAAD